MSGNPNMKLDARGLRFPCCLHTPRNSRVCWYRSGVRSIRNAGRERNRRRFSVGARPLFLLNVCWIVIHGPGSKIRSDARVVLYRHADQTRYVRMLLLHSFRRESTGAIHHQAERSKEIFGSIPSSCVSATHWGLILQTKVRSKPVQEFHNWLLVPAGECHIWLFQQHMDVLQEQRFENATRLV